MERLMMVVAAALFVNASVFGSDAVLNSNPTVQLGFYGATWNPTSLNPATIDPDDDGSNISNYTYLVRGKTLKCKNPEVIKAKSLTIGEVGGSAGTLTHYYSLTVQNEGLFLAKGVIYGHNPGPLAINGKITVLSPKADPFVISDDKNRDSGCIFVNGLSGASTTGLKVTLYKDTTRKCTLNLKGDTSAYLGDITVDGSPTASDVTACLTLSGTACGGCVFLQDKSELVVDGEQNSSLRGLTVQGDTEFVLSKQLTVTDAFVLAENKKIKIVCQDLVSTLPVTEITSIPLLVYPLSSEVEEKDFEFPADKVNGQTPRFALVKDTVAQTKMLMAVYYPVVTMTDRIDGGAGNITVANHLEEDSMTSTDWSDSLAPHQDAYYFLTKITGDTAFVTPYDLENPVTFPGLGIRFGLSTVLTMQSTEFNVSAIRFTNDSTIYGLYSPATAHTLKFQSLSIDAGKTLKLYLRGGSSLTLDGPISGGETATLEVTGATGATSLCEAINMLDGDNTGFLGRINVYSAPNRAVETRGYTTLCVKDAKNLGGPLGEFTYDAFAINNMSILDVLDNVTLDTDNRGVYVDSSATLTDPKAGANCVRFNVGDAAHALSIKETITLNGTIRKTGAGALALGGALKFLDGDGALADDVPARADLHGLIMTGGQLKPLAARSMDGLDIVFSNKVSKLAVGLTIDAATTDAELAQRGFIDLKTENDPIVAVTQSGTIPVMFENLPADPKEAFSVPICTVRKSVAADVLALLVPAEKRIMLGNVKAKITLSASEPFTLDGFDAVTIKADVTPPAGMLLLVR